MSHSLNEYADIRAIEEIRSSGLFDSKWYVETYPDVRFCGMDALEHYLTIGAKLGRDPSPDFNATRYLREHEDSIEAGTNPFLHWIRERRTIGGEARIGSHPDSERIVRRRVAVAIIIPVYNAPEATRDCVASVITHTDRSVRIIVIDDCSPDPEVDRVLAEFEGLLNLRVVRNPRNMGYTSTVNLGIRLAGRADVVLLNSDTRVTPRWMVNLRLAAYSGERVATVTPFSDNAGAFSAPRINEPNPRPDGMAEDEYARCVTRASERLYPEVPTGNGFCMYVRRSAIDEIGDFDAVSFPRGYGEENDFCMRATGAGWTHVIDDATLIYHVRSASFGAERETLVRAGRAVIDERYPGYTASVRAFLADSAVDRARANVSSAASFREDSAARPRVLFVISTTTGGTPQTNGDLMSAIQDRYEPYLLVCDSRRVDLYRVDGAHPQRLESVELRQRILPFPHSSAEYDAFLEEILVGYAIEIVHVRHIGWHSLNLPAVSKGMGLHVVFSFHDFYTICPTIKLLDEQLTYCGGVCTSTDGICRPELWHIDDMPRLKHNAIHSWQRMMREMLADCDLFVTTSRSALAQVLTRYEELAPRCHVIPHGRDLTFESLADPVDCDDEQPVRILVPGNIGIPKGRLLLEEIVAVDTTRRFEFHVLGRATLAQSPGLVLHGTYERDGFAESVKSIKPKFGLILSIWPETHCHTLTELWACGLPVIALDFGAIGERMRKHGGGWLLRHGDASHIYDELCGIAEDGEQYRHEVEAVEAWQSGTGRTETTAWMADQYDSLYRSLFQGQRAMAQVEGG